MSRLYVKRDKNSTDILLETNIVDDGIVTGLDSEQLSFVALFDEFIKIYNEHHKPGNYCVHGLWADRFVN